MDNDWFYSEATLRNIIYNNTTTHLHDRNVSTFHKFAQLYAMHVKRTARYLEDVDFKDLNVEAKESIVVNAFRLWTSYETERPKMVKLIFSQRKQAV